MSFQWRCESWSIYSIVDVSCNNEIQIPQIGSSLMMRYLHKYDKYFDLYVVAFLQWLLVKFLSFQWRRVSWSIFNIVDVSCNNEIQIAQIGSLLMMQYLCKYNNNFDPYVVAFYSGYKSSFCPFSEDVYHEVFTVLLTYHAIMKYRYHRLVHY